MSGWDQQYDLTETTEVLAELDYQRDWLDVTLKLVIVALLAVLSVLASLQLAKDIEVRIVPANPASGPVERPEIRT